MKESLALINYSNTLYEDLRKIQQTYRLVWLERARLLKEIKHAKAYRYLNGNGYESWEEFCRDPAVGMSRVQANLHIAMYEYYVEQLKLKPEDIDDISIGKLEAILIHKDKLDPENRDLAIVEAKLLTSHDFYQSLKERAGIKEEARPRIFKDELGWNIEFNPDTTVKIVNQKENEIIWQNSLRKKLS